MDAEYLKSAVGDSLAQAMTLLAVYQPDDPIEWISDYLFHDCERQMILKKNEDADKKRSELLEIARIEQLRHEKEMREQAVLESLRKPNEEQLNCFAYLSKFQDVVNEGVANGKDGYAIGKDLTEFACGELSHLELSDDTKASEDEPPESIQRIIKAGLLLCKYKEENINSWGKIRTLVLQNVVLRRFESIDIPSMTSKVGLRHALHCVNGIDYQARGFQKHALGPLGTRFNGFLQSAARYYTGDDAPFFEEKEIEEDQQAAVRNIWHSDNDTLDNVLGEDSDEDQEDNVLSVLPGMNSVQLSGADRNCSIHLGWTTMDDADVDVDGAIIIFNEKGQPVDFVYHLMFASRDEKKFISHVEDENGIDSFILSLDDAPKDVSALSIVMNVAIDGESLEKVSSSTMKLVSSTETVTNESGVPVPKVIAEMTLNMGLIDSHEILLGMLHRSPENPSDWTMHFIGEKVWGDVRDEIESQNFLNALPLSTEYFEKLGFGTVDMSERKMVHPFEMMPGDVLEVPAPAMKDLIVIGMGWDVDPDVQMDLDCGIAIYSQDTRVDYCDFEKLVSNDKAIEHQGDNRDGEGEGDDESINVQFTQIDSATDVLFLYAAVYEGGALKDCLNVHIRMSSVKDGKQKEICRFSLDWLANVKDDTAVILAKIMRVDGGRWEFRTIGTTTKGRTIEELEGTLVDYITD
eukprot:m.137751 g.137751  ORF g.137751 m.137751 type:complete len:691 (-) comp12271_c0_seq1:126-2198(-)